MGGYPPAIEQVIIAVYGLAGTFFIKIRPYINTTKCGDIRSIITVLLKLYEYNA